MTKIVFYLLVDKYLVLLINTDSDHGTTVSYLKIRVHNENNYLDIKEEIGYIYRDTAGKYYLDLLQGIIADGIRKVV